MRVFVTGAAGFIGSAVVQELIGAGHKVLGLARSDANAQALAVAGAEIHRGSLEDVESLKSGAAQCDGVIHTAFIHDFSKFAENGQVDKRAIEAMGEVLTGKPLVVSSGTAMIAPGQLATEDMRSAHDALPRVSEQMAFGLAHKGVRATAIRLAPAVHGTSAAGFRAGFVSYAAEVAREKGVSGYVGDGANRWNLVHRLDAAKLYRLALERGRPGSAYHAVGEEGIAVRDIAAAIGRKLNLPVRSIAPEKAGEHFGFLGMFLGLDLPVSSAQTQAELGWKPTGPGLLADLEANFSA
ncbi:MAG TPA: SDR family oxidoreductase [Rhizomicrobium sp.]|jgi:nucleoside-diphosphate-sugar epimerase|nr:SDR family oxidoreductase [Rhizomicrobium sp.]